MKELKMSEMECGSGGFMLVDAATSITNVVVNSGVGFSSFVATSGAAFANFVIDSTVQF
ncbi:hypothetical protein AAES00_26825, partial [Klebsiella pneumoniae]